MFARAKGLSAYRLAPRERDHGAIDYADSQQLAGAELRRGSFSTRCYGNVLTAPLSLEQN